MEYGLKGWTPDNVDFSAFPLFSILLVCWKTKPACSMRYKKNKSLIIKKTKDCNHNISVGFKGYPLISFLLVISCFHKYTFASVLMGTSKKESLFLFKLLGRLLQMIFKNSPAWYRIYLVFSCLKTFPSADDFPYCWILYFKWLRDLLLLTEFLWVFFQSYGLTLYTDKMLHF